jgi:hypothetical protein
MTSMDYWVQVNKSDPVACALADRHYSRRKIGAPQFMPPGQTIVLLRADGFITGDALFGWWRPHPASGLQSMNGLDGWTSHDLPQRITGAVVGIDPGCRIGDVRIRL